METVVIDKSYILKQLQLNSQALKDFGVNQIGLFGSYARNEAKEDSDIDFLVDFTKEEKNLHNLVYLGEFLEKLFERKVDIVTPQGLSNYIGKYILAETTYAAI
jgi:predicted nucleotidyltransferase